MSGHGPRIPDVPPAQSRLTEGNLMYAAVGTDTANPAALAEWFRNQDLPHTRYRHNSPPPSIHFLFVFCRCDVQFDGSLTNRRGTANGLVNVNLPFGSDTLHPHATFELPRMQISGPRYTQPDSQVLLFLSCDHNNKSRLCCSSILGQPHPRKVSLFRPQAQSILSTVPRAPSLTMSPPAQPLTTDIHVFSSQDSILFCPRLVQHDAATSCRPAIHLSQRSLVQSSGEYQASLSTHFLLSAI